MTHAQPRMDFVKKVISSVGVGQGAGCAPNFPFIMEERILSPSTAVNDESFWSVYAGRSVKVPNNIIPIIISL